MWRFTLEFSVIFVQSRTELEAFKGRGLQAAWFRSSIPIHADCPSESEFVQGSPYWSNVPDICSWTDTNATWQGGKHEDLREHHRKTHVKEHKLFVSSCKLVKPHKMRILK